MADDFGANLSGGNLPVSSGPGDSDRAPVVGDVFGADEVNAPNAPSANAPKVDGANAPKKLEQMPQIPQMANAPNAPRVTLENAEFAKSTGWGKLWRIERNGIYFRYKLRFTDAKDTPQEFRKVTRQGGKITPKIEAVLRKRPGHGRHAASRLEAGRFRGRALDLASRIRSSAGRGVDGEVGAFATERGNPASQDIDRGLGRGDMPQLPGVDGTGEMPGVRKSDWVM
jgi:hypothetical protein